ncbi:MAG: hypothetical protein CVU39_25360 [Chloroflexi bacterium HGW-Chloroflexi-10]|nr:MAG: hypothetical protein CVU39_25360 [Chloroflexi bacterium HGW-Chloroflexi-10]
MPNIPEEKHLFLEIITEQLSQIQGMVAVVLGGSYASGRQHANSDLDIGLYYHEAQPFAINNIRTVAEKIAKPDIPATVTDFYTWGAWVNGGAWIHTPVGKVDFLYRNLDQVEKTIADCHQGIVKHDYDQQPSHGYYSSGYLAETQICIPLYDPQKQIERLKTQVAIYPSLMKQRIISDSLWAAEFTLLHARGFAATGDIYNTAGCLVRAAANLTQVLFAINEAYFLSDKKVMGIIAAFSILPAGYAEEIGSILAHPGQTTAELHNAVFRMEAAWQSVTALTQGSYLPKFLL